MRSWQRSRDRQRQPGPKQARHNKVEHSQHSRHTSLLPRSGCVLSQRSPQHSPLKAGLQGSSQVCSTACQPPAQSMAHSSGVDPMMAEAASGALRPPAP